MALVRVVFLWHMHQPYYKDLVTGEYRLPWARLHALKDYYGMVKLLDEFPGAHQTFNLVPSLIAQIQDYVSGGARDPFLEVAAVPAGDLTPDQRRFALTYLFQANPVHMIGRYPRYHELLVRFRSAGENVQRALPRFDNQDFTDLQVLSQLAWLDEFFLEDADMKTLIARGRGFGSDDQRFIVGRQRELLAKVLPAYAAAAAKGAIEISTSPFYHPILPLLCDTDTGAVSSPGLRLPQRRFRHPEDAHTQLERGLELLERTFGVRPRGVWPSEGSLSEDVLAIAHRLGLQWVATDEGVLARTLGVSFGRDGAGQLAGSAPEKLYRVYRYEKDDTRIHILFRDHMLSDLVGFVYAGMPAQEAAADFIQRIKKSAERMLQKGLDATIPIVLDGENAWEWYPANGREFLRRLYSGLQREPGIRALTVSEAIAEQAREELPAILTSASKAKPQPARAAAEPTSAAQVSDTSTEGDRRERRHFGRLNSLVPGSWINTNFNIWIGAPEDNRAWDYLSAARDFYANYGMTATPEQRALAFEEILIAEGSDWNWWYGPEHHTANDRDFDELYRKHLVNVYVALGARPPGCLAQPIAVEAVRPTFVPQTAYIHPRISAEFERYFDWIGAAMYTADRRSGAMHGKRFLLDSVYAGIDHENLYGRLDFAAVPEGPFEVRVNLECAPEGGVSPLTLEVTLDNRAVTGWKLRRSNSAVVLAVMNGTRTENVEVALRRNFAFKLPLSLLTCAPDALLGPTAPKPGAVGAPLLRLRCSVWQQRLPVDALPFEGWIELQIAPEEELEGGLFHYAPH